VSEETGVPLARVCRLLAAPRSTIYARRGRSLAPDGATPDRAPRGPRPLVSDDGLLAMIRDVIRDTPFAGEGHRKVTARLRREREVRVGRKRVLRLMRQAGLLAPQRARGRRKPRPHDGTIIPTAPDRLWGTDATMAYTRDDGWVWAFVAVDHYTAEAWATVAKRGDRFAATEPIYDAVRQRVGKVAPDVARGIAVRHDWGPQYTSGHFQGALRWLGIEPSPAFAGEPPCNGCAERFIRTLKEQCLWAQTYDDLDDLRTAVRAFVERYNTQWLIERHGHKTPREAYAIATQVVAA
jgi:transposase InsO family protein